MSRQATNEMYLRVANAAMEYILNHHHERITLTEFALSRDLSERTVQRAIAAVYDTNWRGLLIGCRIDHAVAMLVTTRKPVLQVARECGIPHSSLFARTFRSQTQCSPAQYREMFSVND